MRQFNCIRLAAALAVCFAASQAQAAITFTVDSAQSYITLNIPNFSYSGNTIDLRGENRTNGAPIGTAWSASTNTGNTAFVTGTFGANIGGSLSGQTVTSVDFVAGTANLGALKSGNYRPNPAAYNTITTAYNNNSPNTTDGNFAAVAHVILGNAAIVAFSNSKFDIQSSSASPASGAVTNGTFNSAVGLNTGILSSTFSVQGLSIILVGQLIPNSVNSLGSLVTANAASGGQYSYTSPTNLRLTVPLSIPISIDTGGGVFINGTASGRFVANAAVPEPSTIALAGLGMVGLVAIVRRRRKSA